MSKLSAIKSSSVGVSEKKPTALSVFKSLTKLDRADLIRLEEDRINKKIISFNLESVLNDYNSPENQLLKPGDHLNIFSEKIYTLALHQFSLKELLILLVNMNINLR